MEYPGGPKVDQCIRRNCAARKAGCRPTVLQPDRKRPPASLSSRGATIRWINVRRPRRRRPSLTHGGLENQTHATTTTNRQTTKEEVQLKADCAGYTGRRVAR